jgi:hypothetical protein
MTIPVLPYQSSFPLTHSLSRDFIINGMGDGYEQTITEEPRFTRADGTGSITSNFGVNHFDLTFPIALIDNGAVQRLASLLWDFFRERLENNNEAFYYYNPAENLDIDLTGADPIGRYLVILDNPNEVLSREYFQAFTCRYSSINLVETRTPIAIESPSLSPSSSNSSSPSA